MAFTRNTVVVNNITNQPNQPIISATALKALFDQSDVDQKSFDNSVLLPELESTTDGDSGLDNIGMTPIGVYTNAQTMLEHLESDKTPLIGNHLGTWQGYNPVQSDPGIQAIVNEHTNEFTKILNKSIFINVKNPPKDTNLLPLTGTDAAQDTIRMQAIFDYVLANSISYNSGTIFTGYSYKIFFPMGTYTFSSKILLKGAYLILEADRAIIKTTHSDFAFESLNANGWQIKMSGFTFDNTINSINFNNDNIDSGYTEIYDCWFLDVPNHAIKISKLSSTAYVHSNKFIKCKYVLENINVDSMYFYNNWVFEKERETNKDATILNRNRLYVYKNLFVPSVPNVGVTETAWINNLGNTLSSTLFVKENHFGGEAGSKTIVNNFVTGNVTPAINPSILSVTDNPECYCTYGECIVRLFAVPNKLEITNNSGLSSVTYSMSWGVGVVPANEILVYSGVEYRCNVIVKNNLGDVPIETNLVLPELVVFTNKFENVLTLSGAWENFDVSNSTAGYWRDENGIVYLKGFIKNGTGVIATLPVGYRPKLTENFAVVANGAFGYITIFNTGVITFQVGSNANVSLSQIYFRTGA